MCFFIHFICTLFIDVLNIISYVFCTFNSHPRLKYDVLYIFTYSLISVWSDLQVAVIHLSYFLNDDII